MATAVITRERLYPTPGKNPKMAWKWLYTVTCDGQAYTGDRLAWARQLAKKKADTVTEQF